MRGWDFFNFFRALFERLVLTSGRRLRLLVDQNLRRW